MYAKIFRYLFNNNPTEACICIYLYTINKAQHLNTHVQKCQINNGAFSRDSLLNRRVYISLSRQKQSRYRARSRPVHNSLRRLYNTDSSLLVFVFLATNVEHERPAERLSWKIAIRRYISPAPRACQWTAKYRELIGYNVGAIILDRRDASYTHTCTELKFLG